MNLELLCIGACLNILGLFLLVAGIIILRAMKDFGKETDYREIDET